MNTVVWIIQGILAALFGVSGFFKMTMPRERLKLRMGWVKEYSSPAITYIGACELLGAIGLILPMAFNVLPILTPLAAIGLAIVMVLATRTHIVRKEYKEIGLTLFLFGLAVFTAINRF